MDGLSVFVADDEGILLRAPCRVLHPPATMVQASQAALVLADRRVTEDQALAAWRRMADDAALGGTLLIVVCEATARQAGQGDRSGAPSVGLPSEGEAGVFDRIRLRALARRTAPVDGGQGVREAVEAELRALRAESGLSAALGEAQRLREALDHVSSYVYLKDPEARYVYGNRPTLDLFGCTAETLVGRDDSAFFPPATVARLREVDARVLGGARSAEEIHVPDTGSGPRVYWEVKAPIYADAARTRLWGLVGISTDITERKRVEAQNAARLEELDRWHQLTLGRESRVLELKREVNALLAAAGQPPRYPSAEAGGGMESRP